MQNAHFSGAGKQRSGDSLAVIEAVLGGGFSESLFPVFHSVLT